MNLKIAWDDVIMMFGSMNSSLWLVLGSLYIKVDFVSPPQTLPTYCYRFFFFFFFRRVTAIYIKYLKFAWISEWIIRKTLSQNNLLYLQKLRSTMVTQYGTEDHVTLATAMTAGKSWDLQLCQGFLAKLNDGCAIILYLVWKCGCQKPWTS